MKRLAEYVVAVFEFICLRSHTEREARDSSASGACNNFSFLFFLFHLPYQCICWWVDVWIDAIDKWALWRFQRCSMMVMMKTMKGLRRSQKLDDCHLKANDCVNLHKLSMMMMLLLLCKWMTEFGHGPFRLTPHGSLPLLACLCLYG